MDYLKKLFLCSFVFFFVHGALAQSLPYQIPAANSESTNTTAYQLVWQDNFDGTTLDETHNWVIEVNGDGGGNAELQYYRRENITVGKEPVTGANCLIITAKKESYSGKTCTSGRLKTFGKMSFKHGKIEARIKLPKTANGLWPAFWMMGFDYPTVGWPKCGEIDMLEMGNSNGINRGTQDKYYSTWYHWGESWNGGSYPNWGHDATAATGIQDDFHLFTLIWNSDYLETYVDLDVNPSAAPLAHMAINGADVAGNAAHYFHKQFYAIFNLAIGGNFTGIHDINNVTALTNGNASMYVDYIRVYQQGVTGEEYAGPSLVQTDVTDIKAADQFSIYPNPANDHINIVANNQPARVVIINMSGQEIMSVAHATSVDTSGLPSGNYLVKIVDRNGNVETHQMTKR
jgi:beta-glucanase (GH16 family)